MKHIYTGEKIPSFVPACIAEGYFDAIKYGCNEQLYRFPIWKKIGYFIGSVAAYFVVTLQ